MRQTYDMILFEKIGIAGRMQSRKPAYKIRRQIARPSAPNSINIVLPRKPPAFPQAATALWYLVLQCLHHTTP